MWILSGLKGNDNNSTSGRADNGNSEGIISDLERLPSHYKHALVYLASIDMCMSVVQHPPTYKEDLHMIVTVQELQQTKVFN